MNELKYQIVQFIFIILLGFGSYWAFTQIDTGIRYERETMVNLQPDVALEPSPVEVVELTVDQETVPEVPVESEPTTTPENKPENLVSELQAMISANVILQQGAKGDQVKSVQNFLDWYFDDRTVSVDSDYGPGTVRLIREFQTKELNGGDGRTGPNTMRKMLELLQA